MVNNNRSPSPSTFRSLSPNPRTPDPSFGAPKKVPWVSPLGSPRHPIHGNPQELPHKDLGSRGRPVSSVHKENELRGRSPMVNSSKGSKSFMAPTISASSKVISASPKRRVLSERNDATRSSFASSVTDSVESLGSFSFDAKSKVGYDSQDELDHPHVGNWESGEDPGEFLVPPPIYRSPAAAAGETSLPPYDPETNYLSPRPRFLHYKPQPRADPEDAKHLEDSFSSDSREESPQRSDDSGPSVTCNDGEGEECNSLSAEAKMEEVAIEQVANCSDVTPKTRSFFRTKLVTLLLLLIIACFCTTISDTPIIPSTPSIPNWHFTSRNISPVTSKLFRNWLADILVQSPSLYREDLGWYGVVNLTSMVERDADLITEPVETACLNHDVLPPINQRLQDVSEVEIGATKSIETEAIADADAHEDEDIHQELDILEQNAIANEAEVEIEVPESVETEAIVDANAHEDEEMEVVEQNLIVTEVADHMENESPASEAIFEEDPRQHTVAEAEVSVDNSESTAEAADTDLQVVDGEIVEDCRSKDNAASSMIEIDEKAEPPSGEMETAEREVKADEADLELLADATESKQTQPLGIIMALSSLIVTVTAAAMSFYFKRTPLPAATTAVVTTPPQPPKNTLVPDSSCSNTVFRSQLDGNFMAEAETLHESGPAVSSSLQNVSLKSKKTPGKVTEEDDVYSHERKPRRDSTVSSSTSFGSFTTYEKRSAKKAGGQDEAMTPVRRSSRIRSLVTTP